LFRCGPESSFGRRSVDLYAAAAAGGAQPSTRRPRTFGASFDLHTNRRLRQTTISFVVILNDNDHDLCPANAMRF
jgi:hypothetical protein